MKEKIEEMVRKGMPHIRFGAVFVAGFITGGLLVWGWLSPEPDAQGALSESPSSDDISKPNILTSSSEEEDAGMLSVPDQPAGLNVVVSRANTTISSWVVIYEDNAGQPGNALGAGRFSSEKRAGVVELLRGTLPQSTYYAVLHRDDGDRIFSLERDFPLRDEEGNPIMTKFMTQ